MVPHLALFTSKFVREGEELCFDYGDSDREVIEKIANVVKDNESLVAKGTSTPALPKRSECLCKSEACKGFLPFDPDLL